MNPDDLKHAWQAQSSQTHLTIDVELLLQEVRRNQFQFACTIFWRDVREVSVALLLAPFWIYLGIKLALPWTWYLTVPALVWIAGYMLFDRRRHAALAPLPGVPLSQCVASYLAQVEHQIRLLRHVFWWYLLPPGLTMLIFLGQIGWQTRAGGWWTFLSVTGTIVLEIIVLAAIYRLNQYAVRAALAPRRQELESLLKNLQEETPGSAS